MLRFQISIILKRIVRLTESIMRWCFNHRIVIYNMCYSVPPNGNIQVIIFFFICINLYDHFRNSYLIPSFESAKKPIFPCRRPPFSKIQLFLLARTVCYLYYHSQNWYNTTEALDYLLYYAPFILLKI